MTGHPAATADVLVIGAGPAGTTAAASLARAGRRAVVVERESAHRSTRGAALLTPAAVATFERVGLGDALQHGHRVGLVRITSERGPTVSIGWPSHPEHADAAVVVHRSLLDSELARLATEAGVDIWFGHEAVAPIVERGFVRGATVSTLEGDRFEARSEYLVVADGADSRFGRALGSFRERSWPLALAHHGEYTSEIHDASEIEIVLGLRDRAGTPIHGYGWFFPTGRGTVDVGVALMSTSPSFQVLHPSHLLDRLVAEHGGRWHLDGRPVEATSGGRIPLGRSVGPAAGPTWLLVGDAAAAADPWSGAGIDGALVTGAIAGEVLLEALGTGAATLQRYPRALDDELGSGYGVGRLVNRLMGRPAVATQVAMSATRSRRGADTFLRLGTAGFRPTRVGPAELVYRAAQVIGPFLPGV